ncbi:hypothetical protein [Agarivorans sp. QJM3NY_25]|uniref:hypothetical protein n=1 Tax=Agarivorans sp. QJM3NY_25 TaxID=3421430 RepID=UPI003D7EB4E1
MKLIFSKNEQLEISVELHDGENSKEFNYVDMVKHLIHIKRLDSAEVIGEFSEAEKASIDSMVTHINSEVAGFYIEDAE